MNGHKACKMCKYLENYIPITTDFVTIISSQNKRKHGNKLASLFSLFFFLLDVISFFPSLLVYLSYAGMCVHGKLVTYKN